MAQRKRTIQHPGFEFWETDTSSTYSYVQNTVALAIGYFTKGPIGIPTLVSDINELASIFGQPENEAEYYSFRGISEILNKGRSVTVIRFPYDNTTSPLVFNDSTKSYFESNFRAIKGNFVVAPESTGKYTDISAAFEDEVTFKTVSLTPDVVSINDILMYNVDQDTDADFIIINKFNDFVKKTGEEYIISVYGAGNAIRNQSLSASQIINLDEIKYFQNTESGESQIYNEDNINYLTYSKIRNLWQTTGEINYVDKVYKTVADTYFNEASSYYPTISTYEIEVVPEEVEIELTDPNEIEKYGKYLSVLRPPVKNIGLPERKIKFNSVNLPELVYKQSIELKELLYSENEIATISYGDVSASGTNVEERIKDLPTEVKLINENELVKIEVSEVANPDIYVNTDTYKAQSYASKYTFNVYAKDKNGDYTILTKSYPISVAFNDSPRDSSQEDLLKNYTWTITLPAEFDKDSGYYVDKSRSNNITVAVSKISRSKLEIGKYVIEPVEIFSGSIYKGSRDLITNESNYIGDIINQSSNIISFYGKKDYTSYDKERDVILVEQTLPYRFSLMHGASVSPTKVDEYINTNKIIKSIKHENVDMSLVLESLLRLVRNNNTYAYTDVYDFGLTSVLTLLKKYDTSYVKSERYEIQPGYYYDTAFIKDVTAINNEFNTYVNIWKRIARKFLNHCQNHHKLSMAFIDGPRHFLLTSNLSRVDDYRLDQNDTVITGKRCQALSIRDCTYGSINVQWWQVQNEFTYEKVWIPNSVFQASNITANDIIYNVWDAPAGYTYGRVEKVFRPACNPNYESKDRLYINCLNYGTAWPDGTNTIEGQKTTYNEAAALNRINVRRLMIYIERFVQTVSTHYRYQPNTIGVRSQLVHELNEEFSRLKTKGALYNYRLVCDETNNTPEVIDQNELRMTIMVQPVRTAEFIVAQFMISKTTTNLDEIMVA